MGDRNGKNQPLACIPHFLVEAQRTSQGLPEEGAAFDGGVPQVSLISGSKTGLLHPRNYLRKTLLIKYLWAGRRVLSPGGEGQGPQQSHLARSKSPRRRDSLEGDIPSGPRHQDQEKQQHLPGTCYIPSLDH